MERSESIEFFTSHQHPRDKRRRMTDFSWNLFDDVCEHPETPEGWVGQMSAQASVISVLCDNDEMSIEHLAHLDNPGEWTFVLAGDAGEPVSIKHEGAARHETLQAQFDRLINEWRKDTRWESSVTRKAMHPAYQRIIGLGPKAIPFLLRELIQHRSHVFWALRAITGEDAVRPEDAGNVEKITTAWEEWGRAHGFL